jgi:hypothetical protein
MPSYVERTVPLGPDLPPVSPLADAARRLKAKLPAPLSPAMLARQERRAAREQALRVQEQERRDREQAQREQKRQELAEFWAAHEAAMSWRPAPVENPVPEEPRLTVIRQPGTHGYGTPVRTRR